MKNSDVINRYTRGLMLRGQGCFAEAAQELQDLITQDDTIGMLSRYHYAMAHRSLSGQALASGDFQAAQRHLKTAMATVGDNCELGGVLAGLYAQGSKTQECLRETEKASTARDDEDSPEFHRRLAQAQWQAGRRQEAELTLSQAFRRFGPTGALHLQQGLFQAAENKFAEARKSLARAAKALCDDPDAHRYLGLAEAATGDAPAAARSFQRALDLRPDDLILAYQLSLAARAASQVGVDIVVRLPAPSPMPTNGNLQALAGRIAVEPDLVEALCSLPDNDMDNDLFALLIGAVELAIEAHPQYADLHLAASRTYARLDQQDAARTRAETALDINPVYVQARLYLAELCVSAGLDTQGARHYERAIRDGADWPDVHLRASEALISCGQNDPARRHLRRALELNAGFVPAARALEALAA